MLVSMLLLLATSIYSYPTDCGYFVDETNEKNWFPIDENMRRNDDVNSNSRRSEGTSDINNPPVVTAQKKVHVPKTNNIFIDNFGNIINYKNTRRRDNVNPSESTISAEYISDLITCRKYSPEVALTLKKLNALQHSNDVGSASNITLANIALIVKGYLEYKKTEDLIDKYRKSNFKEHIHNEEDGQENKLDLAHVGKVIDEILTDLKNTIEDQEIGYKITDLLFIILNRLHSAGLINDKCKNYQEHLQHSIGLVHSVYLDNSLCAVPKYSSGIVKKYVNSTICSSNLKAVIKYIERIIKRLINVSECKDRTQKPICRKYISVDVTRRGNDLENYLREFPKTPNIPKPQDKACDYYNNDLYGLWSLISEHIYTNEEYYPNYLELHNIGLLIKAYLDYEEKERATHSQHNKDLPHKNLVISNLLNVIKDSIAQGNDDIVNEVVELILGTLNEEGLIDGKYNKLKENALRHVIYVAYKTYLMKSNCFKTVDDTKERYDATKEKNSESYVSEEYFKILKQVFAIEKEKKKNIKDCFLAFTDFINEIKRHIEDLVDDIDKSESENKQKTIPHGVHNDPNQESNSTVENQSNDTSGKKSPVIRPIQNVTITTKINTPLVKPNLNKQNHSDKIQNLPNAEMLPMVDFINKYQHILPELNPFGLTSIKEESKNINKAIKQITYSVTYNLESTLNESIELDDTEI